MDKILLHSIKAFITIPWLLLKMQKVSQIFFGLLGIVGAYLLLRYRYQIQEIFGTISWAERYFGSTEVGIVLIAALLFLWGLLYMTGMTDGVITNTFGKLF